MQLDVFISLSGTKLQLGINSIQYYIRIYHKHALIHRKLVKQWTTGTSILQIVSRGTVFNDLLYRDLVSFLIILNQWNVRKYRYAVLHCCRNRKNCQHTDVYIKLENNQLFPPFQQALGKLQLKSFALVVLTVNEAQRLNHFVIQVVLLRASSKQ